MLYSSINNQKIKDIKKLQQKKYRDLTNTFFIESEHLVEEAYKNGYLKELLLKEGTNIKLDIETNYLTEEVIKYITDLESPKNVMGICIKKEIKRIGNKVLALDGIQDPGNLGTIIRSAVAFNIDTIILGNNCVDVYNSKVIRSSQGMIFNIEIVNGNLNEILSGLKNNNYTIMGTKVDNGKDIRDINIPEKFVIVMGNEGNGMSDEITNVCDTFIYIKMNQNCESLNVGVATSIILYEVNK